MTRNQLKDILEIVGIAAIVASLIFVGFQIRQNEEGLRMQFLQGEMLSFQEHFGRVSENESLAEAHLARRMARIYCDLGEFV
jgi:hypothetical protein